jgi:hypothetical protein
VKVWRTVETKGNVPAFLGLHVLVSFACGLGESALSESNDRYPDPDGRDQSQTWQAARLTKNQAPTSPKINLGKAVWRATFVGNEFPAEIC